MGSGSCRSILIRCEPLGRRKEAESKMDSRVESLEGQVAMLAVVVGALFPNKPDYLNSFEIAAKRLRASYKNSPDVIAGIDLTLARLRDVVTSHA